jgi:general secretion pathway protein K
MVKRLQKIAARAMRRHANADQPGIALLAVLLAIALLTLIVMDFTTSSALAYLSAANQANELRASYLGRSAVSVGLALLAQDSRMDAMSKQPFDSLADPWALPFPPMKVGGGTVSLSIVDEARKFNVNQLVNPANGQVNNVGVEQIARLFAILGLPPDLVPALVDWLDRDSVDTPGGAEADFYLRLVPPYEPRNGPMPTIGDLRMVRGVDDATFMKLRNYLTVVPETRVNANTAPPEVLACLEPELASNPRLVQQIIQARTIRPFETTLDVANLPGIGTFGTRLTQVLTTRSVYFTIAGMGTYAGARKLVYSTFRRNGNGTAALASWQEE